MSTLADSKVRTRLAWAGMALVIVVLDQAAKLTIVANMELAQRHAVVPGLFDLTYLLNAGGVWGIGRDLSPAVRAAIFLALPVAITSLAAWYSLQLPASDRLRQGAIALVVGGAVGNLVDRVRLDPPAVIDFLLVHVREHYWPAFNLADSAICIGVTVLLVSTFLEDEPDAQDPSRPSA